MSIPALLKPYYQPYPFLEVDFSCKNCEDRFQAIKNDYGSFLSKSLLDFYSANCYFGFRFIQEGGSFVEAVENNEDMLNEVNFISKHKRLPLICHLSSQGLTKERFDLGLLLDSFGYSDTNEYLSILKTRCLTSYVSAPKQEMNGRTEETLKDSFLITPIYTGIDGKIIFRCKV